MTGQAKVYVIHENSEWLPPLRNGFEDLGTPYEEWLLDKTTVNLAEAPPEGVFFNRMSASNYTRGHYHSNQSTDIVLRWLEAYGRRVINGSSVLSLEFSKAAQQVLLDRFGITTPRTIVAVGRDRIVEAAREFGTTPFFVKPNQGGKGLGVQLFDSAEDLEAALAGGQFPDSVDDVWLIQDQIETTDDFITRAEFVGGKFVYAVKVFSGGSFELCPADACNVDFADFCPAESNEVEAAPVEAGPRFEIAEGFEDPLIEQLEAFLAANSIEVAGVEFIRRPDGVPVVYDVNTNTNYNAGAEETAGIESGGMKEIARFLTGELATESDTRQSLAATA